MNPLLTLLYSLLFSLFSLLSFRLSQDSLINLPLNRSFDLLNAFIQLLDLFQKCVDLLL